MRRFVWAAWVAGLLVVAAGAYSAPEYYEGFDYPAGHYSSQHGWTTQTSNLPYIINAPGASYTDSGGKMLRANGNLAYQTVNYTYYDSIYRSLNSTAATLMGSTGTYYITMLIGQQNVLAFKQPGSSRAIEVSAQPTSDGKYSPMLEVRDASGGRDYTYLPGLITDTDYHFYALRVVNQAGVDQITLLVDPDLAKPAWDMTSGSRIRIDTIDFSGTYSQIALWGGGRASNLGTNAQYWIGGTDEIRITSTWAEAAPYDQIPQPGSGTLSGQIELQNFTPGSSPVAVGVDLVQNGVVVRSETVLPDAEGNYSIQAVDPGTYDVKFKAATWLAKTVSGVVIVDENKICNVSLTNGDVDGDNGLTNADESIVISNMDMTGDQ